MHDRRHALVQHVDEGAGQLRACRFIGHGVGADRHDGAHQRFFLQLRPVAACHAALEAGQLLILEKLGVFRRRRVAGEDHRLALIAGAAVEPVDGDAFRRALQQQAIGIGRTLQGLGAEFDLGAIAGDVDDLLDGQVMAGQRYRLAGSGFGDRLVGGGRLEGEGGGGEERHRHGQGAERDFGNSFQHKGLPLSKQGFGSRVSPPGNFVSWKTSCQRPPVKRLLPQDR